MARSSFLRLSLAAFLALASTGCVNLHGVDAGRGEPVDAGVDSGMDWEPCVIDRPSHLSLYTPDLVSNIELYDELFWNRSNRHAALSLTLSELAPRAPDGTCLSVTPELLARIDDGGAEPLNLVIEVKGERKETDKAKAETTSDLWVPGVNALGSFGRWAYAEFRDGSTMAQDLDDIIAQHIKKGAA